MKIIRLIAISFILGIASGSVSHAAGGEIKLIGAEEGIRNRGRLPAEIVGDVVIVGRHNVDHDRHPGAGRIYTLNRNKWELTAELVAHDRKPNTGQAGFGYDVSISAPPGRRIADYAIIGAPGDDGAAENAGAAYIYAFNSPHWQQEVKLTAADAAKGDAFGNVSRLTALPRWLARPRTMIPAAIPGQLTSSYAMRTDGNSMPSSFPKIRRNWMRSVRRSTCKRARSLSERPGTRMAV